MRGRTEKLHEDVVVDDFDADVSVKGSGDQATDDRQNVTSSLVIVWVDGLDGSVVGVLALVGVLEKTKEHVDQIDEDIGAKHALPEIPRVAHLGEEVEEEHSSTVGIDDGVDTLVSAEETGSTRRESIRWSASKCLDRDVAFHRAVGEVPVTVCGASASKRAEHGCIVGLRSGAHTNSHEGGNNGRPDREVGKPSKTLEGTNLAQDHAEDGDNQEADDKAYSIAIHTVLANGNLGYRSTKTEDKHSDKHEHLQTLQNIDHMPHFLAENTEEGLSEIAEREAVGVHVHIDAPNVPTRNGSHKTENSVERSTWAIASVGERPSRNC
jgi:hypothetical protein